MAWKYFLLSKQVNRSESDMYLYVMTSWKVSFKLSSQPDETQYVILFFIFLLLFVSLVFS